MSPETFHFLFPQHESGNLSPRPKEEARSNAAAAASDAFCNIDRRADERPGPPMAACDWNSGGELVRTKHAVATCDTNAGASQKLFLQRNDNLPSFPPALEEDKRRSGALSAC